MNKSEAAPTNASGQIVPNSIGNPELVFGLVGPIGVDLESIVESLSRALKEVKYDTRVIHLSRDMQKTSVKLKVEIDESSFYSRYSSLISYANEFRAAMGSPAAMAGLAVVKIQESRTAKSGAKEKAALGIAYIVRQFKRPEEISMMRRIYGRKFIQISVYGSAQDRRKNLMEKIASYDASPKNDKMREIQAIKLIDKDANEADHENGQRIADVFHFGDVFVDGVRRDKSDLTIRRFIRYFFGDNSASPNIDEFGLYTASSAALRSADLSRQVGAAIFTEYGDIISMGCNEVPKYGGGNYWAGNGETIYRDIERGLDANHARKSEILFDLIERLARSRMLNADILSLDDNQLIFNKIVESRDVKDSQIMDIIEFGRMIHAEMSALTDAARLGRATTNAVIYCTTFPCHICAKHIIACGIRAVSDQIDSASSVIASEAKQSISPRSSANRLSSDWRRHGLLRVARNDGNSY